LDTPLLLCTAASKLSQKDCQDLGSPDNFLNVSFGNFALIVGADVFAGLLVVTDSVLLEDRLAALFTGFKALFILTHTQLIDSTISLASMISLLMSSFFVNSNIVSSILLRTSFLSFKVTLKLSNFSLSLVDLLKCLRISLAL
jgi:hypothetical protein